MRNTAVEIPRKKRPLGIRIMVALLGIQGLLELLIGIFAIVAVVSLGRTITVHGHTITGTVVDVIGWVLGGSALIVGVITLILAFGLWTLKLWAYWTAVVIMAITLLRQVIEFIKPHDSAIAIVIGMIIPILILIYLLFDPHVRAAFRI